MQLKMYELENMKLSMESHIDMTQLRGLNMNVDTFLDEMAGRIVFKINARLASQKLEEVVARWPATWWQAFKERWYPLWLQKWFPVRWKESRMKSIALYPEMVIPNWKSQVQQVRDTCEYTENPKRSA